MFNLNLLDTVITTDHIDLTVMTVISYGHFPLLSPFYLSMTETTGSFNTPGAQVKKGILQITATKISQSSYLTENFGRF